LPDGGDICSIISKQKGFLQLKIRFNRTACHAFRPWQGDNSLQKGFSLWKKLMNNFPQPQSEQDWKTSIYLTKLRPGMQISQIPSQAEFCFNIRYISKQKQKQNHSND